MTDIFFWDNRKTVLYSAMAQGGDKKKKKKKIAEEGESRVTVYGA